MKSRKEFVIRLTDFEANDLVSVLRSFFQYQESLNYGEKSSRCKLALELIGELQTETNKKNDPIK